MSEAKNATQLETSSPVPRFPEGILFIKFFKLIIYFICHFGFYEPRRDTIYVYVFFAYSMAKLFEKATIPALEAE